MASNIKRQFELLMGLLVPTALTAVSSASHGASQGLPTGHTNFDDKGVVLTDPLNIGIDNMYAAHRSHASHRSHRSHVSSRGGGYTYSPPPEPAPTPTPDYPSSSLVSPNTGSSSSSPPASQGIFSAPSQSTRAKPSTSTGNVSAAGAEDLKLFIMRVQVALMQKGYDPGGVDGDLSGKTSTALRLFQADQGLPVTGTMSTDTLNALGVKI